jgi:hypothetical protein
MDKSKENCDIEERIYNDLKNVIEDKLYKKIDELFFRGTYDSIHIYSVSVMAQMIRRKYLLNIRLVENKRHYDKPIENNYQRLNRVLVKIIEEHKYNLEAVCKYGYTNNFCFELITANSKYTLNIFFRLKDK